MTVPTPDYKLGEGRNSTYLSLQSLIFRASTQAGFSTHLLNKERVGEVGQKEVLSVMGTEAVQRVSPGYQEGSHLHHLL